VGGGVEVVGGGVGLGGQGGPAEGAEVGLADALVALVGGELRPGRRRGLARPLGGGAVADGGDPLLQLPDARLPAGCLGLAEAPKSLLACVRVPRARPGGSIGPMARVSTSVATAASVLDPAVAWASASIRTSAGRRRTSAWLKFRSSPALLGSARHERW